MTSQIKLIALDIDGTLLNSQHQLTPRTATVLKQAMAKGVHVVLATGKTRTSALDTIRQLNLTTPGVYLQGLVIYNGDGTIRHQQLLDNGIVQQVIEFSENGGYPMVAYHGERILTRARNHHTDKLMNYYEPTPEAIGRLQNIVNKVPINKLIFIDEPHRIKMIRTNLTELLDGTATLVQALDYMLEVLPLGASKGAGVKRLIDDMGIAAEDILAVGDGENDIEMLKLAGIGVAVANAMPGAKAAADYTVASHDEDGVAEAVERFVLNS